MKYFISPDQEPINKLSLDNLLSIIFKYFPEAKIIKIDEQDREYLYQFSYYERNEFIEICIPKSLDSLVIETNVISELTKFVSDLRREFSKQDNVLLYDESYSFNVPIPYNDFKIIP